jgi:predicted component of type VI protein secretion system
VVAVLQPLKNSKAIPIDRAVILVGRAEQCDVVITGSKKISRRHCCLVQSDSTYLIRDLGSTNGVWINGKRVDMEGEMRDGDQVAIGDVQFHFFPNGVRKLAPRSIAPASDAGLSDLAGSGIEVIDLDNPPKPVEQVPIFDEAPDVEEETTREPDAGSQTPDEELTIEPVESEPVINLNESFAEEDIEDIVVFDDD